MMIFRKKDPVLRKMDFFSDQAGIIRRYQREAHEWQPHLEATKKFILQSATSKSHGTVFIMGSGWLLDVPLEELSAMFQRVVLFDIYHPSQVRHYIRKFSNVECKELDITGGTIKQTFDLVSNARKSKVLPDISVLKSEGFQYPDTADFYVSVNILNQLDILLADYITKYFPQAEYLLFPIRQLIQQQHINSLPKGRTALITDYEECVIHKRGLVESRKNLLYCTFPSVINQQQWIWKFDHLGLYNPSRITLFKVKAIEF
jgi:hypothetical protein